MTSVLALMAQAAADNGYPDPHGPDDVSPNGDPWACTWPEGCPRRAYCQHRCPRCAIARHAWASQHPYGMIHRTITDTRVPAWQDVNDMIDTMGYAPWLPHIPDPAQVAA